jgi:hypothetical protein
MIGARVPVGVKRGEAGVPGDTVWRIGRRPYRMEGRFYLLIAFVALGALAFAVMLYYREKQRREALRTVAGQLGFSFSPEGDPYLLERLGQFHLFSQGRSRKVRNVMRGDIHDIAVSLFDYRYTTGGGRHNHVHDQTVLLFESERLALPLFTLRPEGVFHKMAGAFGYEDIDFDGSPAFSDAYLLKGGDEGRIRAIFSPEVRAYYTRHNRLCTEGEGGRLVHYRGGRRVSPEWIGSWLQEGLDVLDLFLEKEEGTDTLSLWGLELAGDAQSFDPSEG